MNIESLLYVYALATLTGKESRTEWEKHVLLLLSSQSMSCQLMRVETEDQPEIFSDASFEPKTSIRVPFSNGIEDEDQRPLVMSEEEGESMGFSP